ncbi:MAG: DNA-binding domain-containing protein, partial [Pseudomonadota bacterium]
MNRLVAWQQSLAQSIEADPAAGSLVENGLDGAVHDRFQDGLEIYRNNSLGSRSLALESVYPVCLRLLGTECFRGLAREFVRRHPSMHPDLNRFGAGFANLLDEVLENQLEFARLPWLADLVRLEWLCHQVYYQADDEPLEIGNLDEVDASRLWPRPSRCLAWLRTPWPVHEIWQTHQDAAEPPVMQVVAGEWRLVIERRNQNAVPVVSDSGILDLLDACASGASVAEISADQRLDAESLGELMIRGWIG